MLDEAVYTVPSSFRTLFWDFYSLYHLWWAYGSGKETYGYPASPEMRVHGLAAKVDRSFDEATRKLSHAMIVALLYNIADEAENGSDELYAHPEHIREWCVNNGMGKWVSTGQFVAPTKEELVRGTPSLDKMAEFFAADFWGDEAAGWDHVDQFNVAGHLWSDICYKTAELRRALKSGDIKKMIMAVDSVMHIHHNTGSIFNRRPMRKLGIALDPSDLDARRDAKSSSDFLPHVSPFVRNLINALEPTRMEGVCQPTTLGQRLLEA